MHSSSHDAKSSVVVLQEITQKGEEEQRKESNGDKNGIPASYGHTVELQTPKTQLANYRDILCQRPHSYVTPPSSKWQKK